MQKCDNEKYLNGKCKYLEVILLEHKYYILAKVCSYQTWKSHGYNDTEYHTILASKICLCNLFMFITVPTYKRNLLP